MPIEILEIRTTKEENGEPNGYHIEFEISDGLGAFLWRIGGIPLGTTRQQAVTYLQNNFDEIYAAAVEAGEVVSDLVDNPHVDIQRLLKAFGLVLRDRDEYVIDAINALADWAGAPTVQRPEPVTPQQVYNAARAKYLELD